MNIIMFSNQAHAGNRPAHACFLNKLFLCVRMCVSVCARARVYVRSARACVWVRPSPRLLITSGVCDIDPMQLVK